jgi:hypothetical protein
MDQINLLKEQKDLLQEQIDLLQKLGALNIREKYAITEFTKTLLNIQEDKITPTMLNKKIYEYLKLNHLVNEKRIIRVDKNLEILFGLSPEQTDKINNATHIKSDGCLNMYNLLSFTIHCIVFD